MEVAGLVTNGVTDTTPIVWPKGARHSAGDRRLAEQHDQPDGANDGQHNLEEQPGPLLADIAQATNGQGQVGDDLGDAVKAGQGLGDERQHK